MRIKLLALVGLAIVTVAAAGCAARPRGRAIASAERDARDGPRSGWVSLGRRVTLREDGPPIDAVYPPREDAAPMESFQGPRGEVGETPSVGDGYSYSSYPSYSYGSVYLPPYGGGVPVVPWGPFAVPGGAVPPGLRTPSDTSALSAPYRATFGGGDVAAHRPGLSTGSAFFSRDAR